jgi:hypothetical protein
MYTDTSEKRNKTDIILCFCIYETDNISILIKELQLFSIQLLEWYSGTQEFKLKNI